MTFDLTRLKLANTSAQVLQVRCSKKMVTDYFTLYYPVLYRKYIGKNVLLLALIIYLTENWTYKYKN